VFFTHDLRDLFSPFLASTTHSLLKLSTNRKELQKFVASEIHPLFITMSEEASSKRKSAAVEVPGQFDDSPEEETPTASKNDASPEKQDPPGSETLISTLADVASQAVPPSGK
jgi:hypothetical protein